MQSLHLRAPAARSLPTRFSGRIPFDDDDDNGDDDDDDDATSVVQGNRHNDHPGEKNEHVDYRHADAHFDRAIMPMIAASINRQTRLGGTDFHRTRGNVNQSHTISLKKSVSKKVYCERSRSQIVRS